VWHTTKQPLNLSFTFYTLLPRCRTLLHLFLHVASAPLFPWHSAVCASEAPFQLGSNLEFHIVGTAGSDKVYDSYFPLFWKEVQLRLPFFFLAVWTHALVMSLLPMLCPSQLPLDVMHGWVTAADRPASIPASAIQRVECRDFAVFKAKDARPRISTKFLFCYFHFV
jgi:hypothetical protein